LEEDKVMWLSCGMIKIVMNNLITVRRKWGAVANFR